MGTTNHSFLAQRSKRTGWLIFFTVAASFLGKLLGFIRLQQIALTLGVSYHADVLLLAFQLIWMIETVLISSAAVPMVISRIYDVERAQGEAEAAHLFLNILSFCLIASGIWGCVLFFGGDIILNLTAPGFGSSARDLYFSVMAIGLFVPALLTLAQFLGLINRLAENGVWYSMPQIVTNASALAGLVFGAYSDGVSGAVIGMILGLLVGAVGVTFMQILAMPSAARKFIAQTATARNWRILKLDGAKPIWFGVGALLSAAFVQELYVYIDFYFASKIGEGSLSIIAYASRLAALTNMLMVGAALVILEPRWARAVSDNKVTAVSSTLTPDALSLISLTLAPAAILFIFPDDVTGLVYGAGAFLNSRAADSQSRCSNQ